MTRYKRSYLLLLIVIFSSNCERGSNTVQTSGSDQPLVIRATQSPTDGDSREPDLTTTPDGRVILSWVEKLGDKRYALRTALLDRNGWSAAQTVAQGDNWFINWADFPSVIALKDGTLAAHWLVKSGSSTYAYDVNISSSNDAGKNWIKPIVPHRDNTQTEHGFVSLIPLADGRLGAVWLDGRNMKNMKESEDHGPAPESMTLRYATVDANGNLSDETELDERVCECCQTSATVTSAGPIAVYRDRSQSEVRDIYVVRQVNGSWTKPQAVFADNWQINGCPVNGPAVATDGSRVAVAWFTRVADTPRVKVAFSQDAGATFSQPVQVDDGETVGRVDTLLLPDGSALVCWLSGNVEGGAIKVRRVRADGSVGPAAVIAKTDISRSSGFPRMARLGDEVHFAWTEFGKPSRVRTAVTDVGAYK
ncbi:MAG TPA: sialidase family protein [Pyrinomonadaceae bacterium]|nr:sialidase family protein [Pyrinomonadaceae bacterium]